MSKQESTGVNCTKEKALVSSIVNHTFRIPIRIQNMQEVLAIFIL